MAPVLTGALFVLALANSSGWAVAALPAGRRDALAVATTTLALSIGALTQAMFWIALARPGHLRIEPTLVALAAISAAGWGLAWRARRPNASRVERGDARRRAAPTVIAAAVAACCLAIVVGAASWPFSGGDALAVYAPLSRGIATFGTLPIGERLYEGYPMLVPMLYAFVDWIAGGPNEYLSRFATALLAVGAVAGAGWLARELRSPRAGWIAAALLVSSPIFGLWAATGYADIPAGFYVVLVAIFVWRWRRDGDVRDALLSGVAAGLAMWTKNSALTLVVSAPLLVMAWRGARGPSPGRRWTHAAAAVTAAAFVAAPWYVRNEVVFGFLVPPTLWADRVRHDLASFLVFLRPADRFGLLGWLALLTVAVAAVRVAARGRRAPAEALLLSLSLPFFAAWWWLASYDPRFLVSVLPLLAGFAGALLDDALGRLEGSPGAAARRAWAALIAALLAGMPFSMRYVLPSKRAWLANPFMSDLARHRLQVGGLFDLGRALDALPEGSRIAGVPTMARYYLNPERRARVAWAGPDYGLDPPGYDYEVLLGPPRGNVNEATCAGRLIFRSWDGYLLCRVSRERAVARTLASGER